MYAEMWAAFLETFRYWLPQVRGGREDFGRILAGLERVEGPPEKIEPNCPPVVGQWLTDELPLPAPRPLAILAQLLIANKTKLDWRQLSVEYAGDMMAREYAFAPLVGPPFEFGSPPLFFSAEVSAGVTLQAPHLLYPAHWHPAVEFYGVVAGTGQWQLGDAPFVERPAGSLIHHKSMISHAMKTTTQPMLTVYAWTGDLYTFPEVG